MNRRWLAAGIAFAGSALLGRALSAPPASTRFFGTTAAVAATWLAGGLALGRVPRGKRQVVAPVVVGVGAFGAFYAAALVSRHIPPLDRAIAGVLDYSEHGSPRLVLLTTLATGAAEEVFFRGALPELIGPPGTVAVYALATTPTRNPALVLAAVVMGTLFTAQRNLTGGIQAPVITHLVWSTLMLRYLPPLFEARKRLIRHGDTAFHPTV
ncbi:CPBP family intramembrane glutamic endopeptidase [Actinokineospora sp. HUAS TT18]|uniref:CPBP family intramembrane glutamic endopeptidase n=1 Tax=Actinokineospora sp. HUAS TT18 TaxID=3447451 RepID=UPI003F52861E